MDATVARARELDPADAVAARDLMRVAFGTGPEERFSDDDWDHALGGTHVVARVDGELVGHASVVPRTLHVGDAARSVAWHCGYVEAVAVHPDHQGKGIGTALMDEVARIVREGYDLGALGTGRRAFYARLGWEAWRGPVHVVRADGWERLRDEEGYVFVLRHGPSAGLPLSGGIACEERPGDDW
jgi:aminoglycoside 2'-N-acetyltransferase I